MLFYLDEGEDIEILIAIKKMIKGSVVRNKIKRRVKHLIKEVNLKRGKYIIMPHDISVYFAEWDILARDLKVGLEKVLY